MIIYKYPLIDSDGLFIADIVASASAFKPLHVDVQRGVPCLWAETSTGPDEQRRWRIKVVGTGVYFDPDGYKYCGTFQYDGEFLVFHVYCEEQ